MISSVAWIPKGAAKQVPEVAELTEEEIAALKAAGTGDGQDAIEEESDSDSDSDAMDDSSSDEEQTEEQQVAKAKAFAAAIKSTSSKSAAAANPNDPLAAAMAELDMEHYDDTDDEGGPRILGSSNNPGLSYYQNPEDDPNLKHDDDSDDETDSEAEALNLRDNDLLIIAARNEDDVSHLEVWVYEEPDERGAGNLYVHHTLMLSAFPLAVAWMDCDPLQRSSNGNFAAVASFEPAIEIWDLDVLDAVEPIATLGGCDYEAARAADGKKKKKKKGKSKAPDIPVKPGSHTDAVLGLAWNREFRNVLASASADKTVKVWDVTTQQCSQTLTHHTDKVQTLAWNPVEASVLLSGGFDKRAILTDGRTPDADPLIWTVNADVEALTWDPHSPTCFAISSEDGEISYFDARGGAGSAPLYRFTAHSKPATCLAFNPTVPGLLLTGSTDKKVSLWKIEDNKPTALSSADLKVGAVFSANFCRDSPFLVAAGGAKGTVSVWDTTTESTVVEYANSKGVAVELTELLKSGRKQRKDGDSESESEEESDGDSDSD